MRIPIFGKITLPRHTLGKLFRTPLGDFMDAVYGHDVEWTLDSLDRNKIVRDATIKIRELEKQNSLLRGYVKAVREGECTRCAVYASHFIDRFRAHFTKHQRDYQ